MNQSFVRSAPASPRPVRPLLGASLLLASALFGLPAGAASAGRWRPIGLEGASIMGLATAPGAANVVYAVTGRRNVVRSSDGAETWSSRGRLPSFWEDLAVDPARSDVLYANSFNGLYKSIDGGISWSESLGGRLLWAFRLAPSTPDLLYAAQEEELLKSVDGGAHWTSTGFGSRPAFALAVDPQDSRVVYAGGQGLWRSDDGGDTWTALGAGLQRPDGTPESVELLEIDPRHPEILYAVSFHQLFKSADRGVSWSVVWAGPTTSSWIQKLWIDPGSEDIYAVVRDDAIYRSGDGGASWNRSLPVRRTASMAFDAHSARIFAGTEAGGVFRSTDGVSWTAANHGLREVAFVKVAADPHTPGVIFALATPASGSLGLEPQFLLRTTDGGAHWTSTFGSSPDTSPLVNDLVADPSRTGTWYLACFGGVLKTEDGGETWAHRDRGVRPIEFMRTIALAPSNPDALYAIGWDTFPICGGLGCPQIIVYRSVDGAAQWRRSRGLVSQRLLSYLAVDVADPFTVYAAGPKISKSTDGGMHWLKTGQGLRGTVTALVADPFSPGTLYAGIWVPHGRRIFKSTDGGESWTRAAGGLTTGISVQDLAADHVTPGTLYAATSHGVYVTRNGGGLWTPMNDGLEDLSVWTVAVDPLRPGVVYAGGFSGLFEFATDP
jgi:photosystem II stability/assembly factor-like uncharacterized protein